MNPCIRRASFVPAAARGLGILAKRRIKGSRRAETSVKRGHLPAIWDHQPSIIKVRSSLLRERSAALEKLPAFFEGPRHERPRPDKVDADRMKELRRRGLARRRRRR